MYMLLSHNTLVIDRYSTCTHIIFAYNMCIAHLHMYAYIQILKPTHNTHNAYIKTIMYHSKSATIYRISVLSSVGTSGINNHASWICTCHTRSLITTHTVFFLTSTFLPTLTPSLFTRSTFRITITRL